MWRFSAQTLGALDQTKAFRLHQYEPWLIIQLVQESSLWAIPGSELIRVLLLISLSSGAPPSISDCINAHCILLGLLLFNFSVNVLIVCLSSILFYFYVNTFYWSLYCISQLDVLTRFVLRLRVHLVLSYLTVSASNHTLFGTIDIINWIHIHNVHWSKSRV